MIPVSAAQLAVAVESYKKPLFKIVYINSPYGVNTLGYTAEYFDDPSNASSLTFQDGLRRMRGKENILAHNWELGAPPGVSSTNYFKGRFYGYFYAQFTGTYTFFASKEPSDYVRLYIDTTRSIVPTATGSYASILIDEWGNGGSSFNGLETVNGSVTLTAGNWYPMLIDFAERTGSAYIVVRYREPDGIQDANGNWSDYDSEAVGHNEPVEHRKILSAGVFANLDSWEDADDAGFLTEYTISGVQSADLDIEANQSNTLQFTVPLLTNVETTSGLRGFRLDPETRLYIDDESGAVLRQGRLVKFYTGYAVDIDNPADTDYVQRFEGIITDMDVNKGGNGSTLKITCQDLLYFMVTQINENYPDTISYVSNDFTSNSTANEPAGLTRPVAYDAWPIDAIVRDLAIKAGIDPTKLYGRRKFLSVRPGNVSQSASNVIATGLGGYKIESQNIQLRRRQRYGNPSLSNQDKDDPYIWTYNFGETVYDMITRLSDTYGFDISIDNEGDLRFSSVNAPTTFGVDSHTFSYGSDWQQQIDLGSDFGKYIVSNERDATVTIIATGSEFALNFIRENTTDFWLMHSSWSPIYNELPSGIIYDPTIRDVPSIYGTMYGRLNYADGNNYIRFDFPVTTVYVRPTKTITLEEIRIKYNDGDYPESFGATEDLDLYLDIYIGEVQGGDFQNLVASSLVLTNYTRLNTIGNNTVRITLADGLDNYTLQANKIYGIRFESQQNGTLPRYRNSGEAIFYHTLYNVYSMEYMSYTAPSSGPVRASKWNKRYDPETGVWSRGPIRYDNDDSLASYHNIVLIGGALNLGGDPTASRAKIEVRPAIFNGSAFTTNPTFTTIVDNIYNDKTGLGAEYRYPSDGKDYTGENPCVVYLRAEDIGLVTSGDVTGPHNKYQIKIINLAAGQSTRIASVDVFDEGLKNPTWKFDTSKNIVSLGINESTDDTRNDIIVVGDKIGAFTHPITDEVVNPNNPALQYVFSRATDISSINDPNSRNNIGRKKPFLIFEPGLVDQKHADWLAQEVLTRYHAFRQTPNWKSWGIPFIEIGDSVFISDRTNGVEAANTNITNGQWVVSISEKISHANYEVSLQTTPYEPWASFTPNPSPSLNDFGGIPFINIRMTDSAGNLRGYADAETPPVHIEFDVYESESGNRLQVKYDQVVDGDIVVKVMSKSVLGRAFSRPVAYLVGGVDNNGIEKYEYREWGKNYTLQWDGVDEFGDARRQLGFSTIIDEDEDTYITRFNNVDYIAEYDQPGFYVPSGQYFLRFIIYPYGEASNAAIVVDTDKLSTQYNQTVYDILYPNGTSATYAQKWYIKWGDLPETFLTVSGERPGNAKRDIMYGTSAFYSDEFAGRGPQFTLSLDPTSDIVNHTMYYKVNIDHYWAVGYTFVLRSDRIFQTHIYNDVNLKEDWFAAFSAFAEHSYMSRRHMRTRAPGGYGWEEPGYWVGYAYLNNVIAGNTRTGITPSAYFPGSETVLGIYKTYHIRGYEQVHHSQGSEDYRVYVPSIHAEQHPLDTDYYCSVTADYGNDINDYRVLAWKQVPYTHYEVNDFIPPTKHSYSHSNPILFYMNPTDNVAGGWTFGGLPDMSANAYQVLADQLPIAAFYAGPQHINDPIKRLNLCTQHTFQVNILVWDNTGRIMSGGSQAISQGPVEHQHGLWGDDPSPYPHDAPHTHDRPENDIVMSPRVWRDHRNRGTMNVINHFLKMDNPGGTSPNWGQGYCNISGMSRYGYWTWHGAWHSDDYTIASLSRGGFAQYDRDRGIIDGTNHWISYEGTSTHDGRTVIVHWPEDKNRKTFNSPGNTWHGHFPYYEGQSIVPFYGTYKDAYDPDGIIGAMMEKDEWNFDTNTPEGREFNWSETEEDEGWQFNPINRVWNVPTVYAWYIVETDLPYYALVNNDPDQHKTWGNFLWSSGVDANNNNPLPGLQLYYGGWSRLSTDGDEEL